jgi:hypothetical protein
VEPESETQAQKGEIMSKLRERSHPIREEIELRAHRIYVERGGSHGQDVEDWLQAERELEKRGKLRLHGKSESNPNSRNSQYIN